MGISFREKIPDHIIEIIRKIQAEGFKAVIVGGALRDIILQKKPGDWDIATNANPEEIMNLFLRVVPTGIKHGTVSIVMGKRAIEVTTFRSGKDFSVSLEQDLRQRDFTINAMAYDPVNDRFVDRWGGLRDVKRRTIRAVEDPEARFNEDPLRILRAIRMAATLDFKIDPRTFDAIPRFAEKLLNVSIERIRDEFLKIFDAQKPSEATDLCRELGILKIILPEILEGYGMEQNVYHRYDIYWHSLKTVDFLPPRPFLRWVGLLHDVGKPRVRKKINDRYHFYYHAEESAKVAREIMLRWKFSRKQIESAQKLIANHMIHSFRAWKPAAFRRLIIRVGEENIEDLLLLWVADRLAHGRESEKQINEQVRDLREKMSKALKRFDAFSFRDLAINGNDVMNILGISPGPEVGQVLKKLHEFVIEHPEKNTKKDLVELIRGMVHECERVGS